MKNIYKYMQLLLLGVVLVSISSCISSFEDMNLNPNEVTSEQLDRMNYRVGSRIKELESLVVPVQEHMYQFNESLVGGPFGGYIGSTIDTWLTKFETFNPPSDWRKWPFANVMTDTYAPFRGIINLTDDKVAIALAKVLRVAIMNRMTDSYGPIPYNNAVNNESIYVAYEKQSAVYTAMFEDLDQVIAVFAANTTLPASAFDRYDMVYYGNIAKWLKYANSLKLRLAMRLSYVMPELARTKAAEAIAGSLIETNADNAAMHAAENRTTLIYNDWADHRVGADIINYMNGYNDPRRASMFTKTPQNVYAGIRIGIDVWSKSSAVLRCSNLLVTSSTPYLWMNAAEITFLRAEYELRWGSVESAKTHYENAIRLSFEERGASGVDLYIANNILKPEIYSDPLGVHSESLRQSEITIAWETGSDPVTVERNIERIITQKWIAIFPLGTEAWSEYRRTGYPRLLPAIKDKSGGSVDLKMGARRLPYPVEEYQKNSTNLQAAIQLLDTESQGSFKGDKMGTRVWWDCKPLNK